MIPTTVERVTVSSGEPMTLPDGAFIRGRLYFTAPDLNIISDEDFVFGGTVIAELVDGEFTVDLVPQDATGIDPSGWSYVIRGEFYNAPDWVQSAQLTKDEPSVILSDIIEAVPLQPEFTSGFLPLAGGTMTGDIVLANDPDQPLKATTKQYADAGDNARVSVSGDAMTGELSLQFGRINSNVGHDLSMSVSTGIMHQTGPIVQDGPTSISVPMGLAMFVDPAHDHSDPKLDTVEYGGASIELDDTSDPLTYFMVDPTGAIVQNAGVPTRAQRRSFAILGRAVVLGGEIVNVQDSPILNAQPLATTMDLMEVLGVVRASGIHLDPIAGGLTVSLTSGGMLNIGANNSIDPTDPNVSAFNAQSPVQFRYATRDAVVDTVPRTNIDPDLYDDGTGAVGVVGGSGKTTIQRVHCFPTQNVFIQLGQQIYDNLDEATADLSAGGNSGFVTNPDLVGGGILAGFIVTTRVATNLADPVTTRFYRATKFGDVGGVT
jgi:hypothetical protein